MTASKHVLNDEENPTFSDPEEEIYHIHRITCKNNPYVTNINVNGKSIKFEIDTGAGVTITSEQTYHQFLQEMMPIATYIKIKTYSNESLPILGMLCVDVIVNDHSYTNLKLYVLEGSGTNLLARDWLNLIQLD